MGNARFVRSGTDFYLRGGARSIRRVLEGNKRHPARKLNHRLILVMTLDSRQGLLGANECDNGCDNECDNECHDLLMLTAPKKWMPLWKWLCLKNTRLIAIKKKESPPNTRTKKEREEVLPSIHQRAQLDDGLRISRCKSGLLTTATLPSSMSRVRPMIILPTRAQVLIISPSLSLIHI